MKKRTMFYGFCKRADGASSEVSLGVKSNLFTKHNALEKLNDYESGKIKIFYDERIEQEQIL